MKPHEARAGADGSDQGEDGRRCEGTVSLSTRADLKGKRKAEGHPRSPLLAHLISIRKRSFTMFVSNMPPHFSKPELEAIF